MKYLNIIISIIVLSFTGCSFIEELAHMTPPEIVSYSPNSVTTDADSISSVNISFSETMDKTKTENAFTFTEDGTALNGTFNWSSNTISFTPFSGIKSNKEYEIALTANAEDTYGNSLSASFTFKFFTGIELVPPEVTNTSPVNGEILAEIWQQIIINLSEPVNTESFYSAFSINPDVPGSFTWNADYSTATFTPTSNYEQGEEYRVEISTELTDSSGNNLPETYYFYFTAGIDQEQAIVSVETEDDGINIEDITQIIYNTNIQKNESFIIRFLYPVSSNDRTGIIDVTPSTPHNIVWEPDFLSCTLSFDPNLVYGNVYKLEVLDSIYWIRVDNPNSIPPQIRMVAYSRDIANTNSVELELNDTISISATENECFDFYIQHAVGYPVDISSFLSAVDIGSTSECATIVKINHENGLANITTPPGLADFSATIPDDTVIQIIRIYCDITDAGSSGIITISIDTDLFDTNNNYMEEEYKLTIRK